MFTVKVIRPNGNEDLYEAREITKEPNGLLMQIGYEDTIYLGEGGAMMTLDCPQRVSSRSFLSDLTPRATTYVMNRFGSTVATYTL